MSLFPLRGEAPFPTEGDGSYNEVFRKMPFYELPTSSQSSVITVNSNSSVAEAVEVLGEHQILSAPVRDVTQAQDAAWIDKYSGVVDFMAIVNWMMDGSWGHSPESLEQLRYLKKRFASTTVAQVLPHARASPFIPIDPSENSFLDVMILLGKYGVRRVFTVNTPGGDITGVISQSMMLELVGNNLEQFSGITSKPISALGLGNPTKVISVGLHDSYWDAFNAISKNMINSVPIVDDEGRLVGNVSARDLKHMILEPAKFAIMAKPIGEFLTRGLDLFTCRQTDTLEAVVRKFQASRVHCLYVVDAQGRPNSVVAIRDVLAAFVREPEVDSATFQAYFSGRASASGTEE